MRDTGLARTLLRSWIASQLGRRAPWPVAAVLLAATSAVPSLAASAETRSSQVRIVESTASTSSVTPQDLKVDPAANPDSDGNEVLEPGETALVLPSWGNDTSGALSFGAAASAFQGPGGATYMISDDTAAYGPIDAGTPGSCSTTLDCYSMSVPALAARPATHWDAAFVETPSTGDAPKTWTIHLGDTFTDVPRSHPFYTKVETLLHNGITAGCGLRQFCPGQVMPNSQVTILLARAAAGGGANIPVSGTVGGLGYNCEPGGLSLFHDVAPTDIYCKHAHYLASRGIAIYGGGPERPMMLPSQKVRRSTLAIWIARVVLGGDFPPIPQSYGPDPVTGRSYNCNSENPEIQFVDAGSVCAPIHFIWAKGIIAGCSPTAFCPSGFVTRDQIAKFLVNAFGLTLYGP